MKLGGEDMSETTKNQNFRVVPLSESVKVKTDLQEIHLPALRSGFAGYPMNPRWNALKFRAWKLGRQWRQALLEGELYVRPNDLMLVSVAEADDVTSDTSTSEPSRSDREESSPSAKPSRWGTRILALGW
ncbi:hypothetical protein CKA32_004979 [Geitlerinema sp. FC II]|nr:hypothetical protein CKA32_004979 [Geitlerinema sp. FC II]